ncbi:MAG: metallophosphoesterase, partial [Candidatus Binatia bacterium]
RTAPSLAEPFRFTAFGDQGVSATAATMTGLVSDLDPAFHFHVGDLCYAHTVIGLGIAGPTDQAVWDLWFAQISTVAASRPWMTAVGNHEMEPGYGELGYGGYLSRFTLPEAGPSGAPTVYAFRYGNVALIALDANDASYEIPKNRCYLGSTQDEWLRSTLASLRADPAIDFIVVGFHHCAYCTNFLHGSDGGVRDRWGTLFDEFNVDLVINGHNHCYERTHPVRDGAQTRDVAHGGALEPVSDGTTYVTAGGGGSTIYPLSLSPASYVSVVGGLRIPELADWSATRALELSVLAADVVPPAAPGGETTMTLTGRRADGSVIEQITLRRNQGERYLPSGPGSGGATILAPLGSCDLPGSELP